MSFCQERLEADWAAEDCIHSHIRITYIYIYILYIYIYTHTGNRAVRKSTALHEPGQHRCSKRPRRPFYHNENLGLAYSPRRPFYHNENLGGLGDLFIITKISEASATFLS